MPLSAFNAFGRDLRTQPLALLLAKRPQGLRNAIGVEVPDSLPATRIGEVVRSLVPVKALTSRHHRYEDCSDPFFEGAHALLQFQFVGFPSGRVPREHTLMPHAGATPRDQGVVPESGKP